MAEVPRIVRERLQSQATASEHPDANLLSAFAERALTEPERARVLDHLSRCSECREVVALSAPEIEEERLVAAAGASGGARRSWWRSPIVHWSALTAAALVVLIAVGERMRLREGRSASAPAVARLSTNEVAQKSAVPVPEVSSLPAQRQQSSKKVAKPSAPAPQAPALSAGKAGGGVGAIGGGKIFQGGGGVGTGSGGGIGSGSGAQSAPTTAPPPVAPQMKMQAKAADAGGLSSDTGVEQSQQKPPLVPPAASEAVVVTGALGAPAPKSKATILSRENAMLAKRKSLSPRWSVSDSGVLQRSFDGGRSWQDVAVGDGITFRTVSTVGSEVWAGGSAGALYHSADGGEHWAPVRVEAKGRDLSGDIVRIEFTGIHDGVVTTSTGETWMTSDAGATWQPQ